MDKLDRLTRGWRGAMALVALCMAVYLPGLWSIPPVDRDESRFAQASRQMFESVALPESERSDALHDGGVAVPKVQDRLRLNKPPLIYWLQALSAATFSGADPLRDAIWMYRLPSALCALIAVLCTWRLGVRMFDDLTGWLAGALLSVCPMVVWDAHQARADQLLLACTTSALAALWAIRSHPRRRWMLVIWFWASCALGILAKGPITPMVVLLTALWISWTSRDWRWLVRTGPALGVAILVIVIAPWVVLVVRHVGADEVWRILIDETLGRSTSAKEGHFGPPGYHAIFAAILFWPGSMLTLAAFVRTWKLAVRVPLEDEATLWKRLRTWPSRWKQRVLGRERELFLVAWIVPSWVVFELVMTKLPHYTLPMYPALALISAAAVLDAARARIDSFSAERVTGGLNVWFAIGLAMCCVVPIGLSLLGGGGVAIGTAALVASACGWMLWKGRDDAFEGLTLRAQLWSIAATVLFVVGTLGIVLPRADVVFVYPRAGAAVPADRPVACAGGCEDSVVFLTRGRIEHVSIESAMSWLRAHKNGVLLLPRSESTANLDLRRLDTFAGYNYAAGRTVTLDLVELAR